MGGSTAENLARLATVIGVLAIPIAWKTLTTTWDTNRASHMNTLFREFLRLEFDYFNQPANQASQRPAWESLRSYKMWVLEEIWIWVDSQQHRFFPMQPGRANRHRELLAGWDATLKYHLGNRPDQKTWDEFYRNRKCYHKGFVAFAMRHHPCSPFHVEARMNCTICGQEVAAGTDWALLNEDGPLKNHWHMRSSAEADAADTHDQLFSVVISSGLPLVVGLEAFALGGFSALGLRTSLFDFF